MTTRITSPRRWRATRAAQRWAEGGDLLDIPLSTIQDACGDEADRLGRDLNLDEVNTTCSSTVKAALLEREREANEKVLAERRERERLAYLEKVRADIISRRGEVSPRKEPPK